MVVSALSTIASKWGQSKYLLIYNLIKKMWLIYKDHTALQRNSCQFVTNTDGSEKKACNVKEARHRQILHDISYM